MKRNPAISLLVEDSATFTSVVAYGYGRAEIIEHNVAALTRPIIEKYVPEARREEMLKRIANDPHRVIVVLHPEKIIERSGHQGQRSVNPTRILAKITQCSWWTSDLGELVHQEHC